jgi:hypothetical protein
VEDAVERGEEKMTSRMRVHRRSTGPDIDVPYWVVAVPLLGRANSLMVVLYFLNGGPILVAPNRRLLHRRFAST